VAALRRETHHRSRKATHSKRRSHLPAPHATLVIRRALIACGAPARWFDAHDLGSGIARSGLFISPLTNVKAS
jgi:hypothetical protein